MDLQNHPPLRNDRALLIQSNPNLTHTMTHTDNLCLGMAAVYSFFGITLAVAPKLCWGPESPLSYWTEMDESGVWFGRALGVCA